MVYIWVESVYLMWSDVWARGAWGSIACTLYRMSSRGRAAYFSRRRFSHSPWSTGPEEIFIFASRGDYSLYCNLHEERLAEHECFVLRAVFPGFDSDKRVMSSANVSRSLGWIHLWVSVVFLIPFSPGHNLIVAITYWIIFWLAENRFLSSLSLSLVLPLIALRGWESVGMWLGQDQGLGIE